MPGPLREMVSTQEGGMEEGGMEEGGRGGRNTLMEQPGRLEEESDMTRRTHCTEYVITVNNYHCVCKQ